MKTRVTYGIVGAGPDSFIGGVHRIGAAYDLRASLVAGCFSRNAEKNQTAGNAFGVSEDRIYETFEEMAEKEAARDDGIDFVTITAPNNVHYAAAKAFLEQGIHVLCEKPLCFTVEEAVELKELAASKGLLFCVNYSYTGNVMVKEAREIVRSGQIGEVINVNAEYLQEYLVDDVSTSEPKMVTLSSWRKDPEISGGTNCVGDIGSHIENTVSYITGLKLKRVAAKLDYWGQPLDLNANILVEFENGAHGVFCSSQVCIGHMNGLVVRIFGTLGAIEWVQENPNVLYVTMKGEPTKILNRGMGYVSARAQKMNRIPSGHPEGLFTAFANIYKVWIDAVLKKANGEALTAEDLDFPSIDAGIEGVKFIKAALSSTAKDAAWEEL